jgi:hypothetical protein
MKSAVNRVQGAQRGGGSTRSVMDAYHQACRDSDVRGDIRSHWTVLARLGWRGSSRHSVSRVQAFDTADR